MKIRKFTTFSLIVLVFVIISSSFVYGLPLAQTGAVEPALDKPASILAAVEWVPTPVADDPLVRMPGSQPGQVLLEGPNRCLNCYADYDQAVEPGFNWKGSLMAQAGRDFLFWSCLTVAGQDSIWAVGSPNAIDICERCHFPKGWLEGRSDPPNLDALNFPVGQG